jgi:hypothetical protein
MVVGLVVVLWAAGVALLPFRVSQGASSTGGVVHIDCRSPVFSAFKPGRTGIVPTGHQPRVVAPVLILPSNGPCRRPARHRLARSVVLFGLAGLGTLGAVRILREQTEVV